MDSLQINPWFALQVKSRYENSVAAHLAGKGYEWFLPLYESRRRWSDRNKKIEQPLFPGYVFCRFNPLFRLPILITPGVIGIVGVGKMPVPIEDSEIASIQTIVKSGLPNQPWPFLQVGERVRIESGPLEGLEGILLGSKGNHRVVVSVMLLQRSVAAEIDRGSVSRVRQPHYTRRERIAGMPVPGHAVA